LDGWRDRVKGISRPHASCQSHVQHEAIPRQWMGTLQNREREREREKKRRIPKSSPC